MTSLLRVFVLTRVSLSYCGRPSVVSCAFSIGCCKFGCRYQRNREPGKDSSWKWPAIRRVESASQITSIFWNPWLHLCLFPSLHERTCSHDVAIGIVAASYKSDYRRIPASRCLDNKLATVNTREQSKVDCPLSSRIMVENRPYTG